MTELVKEECPFVDEPLVHVSDEDMEAAHRYADQIEELLPHVAHDADLWAVLTYELAGGVDEPIKLSSVVDDAAWRSCAVPSARVQYDHAPRGRPGGREPQSPVQDPG